MENARRVGVEGEEMYLIDPFHSITRFIFYV
jgi:hypothetical protein